MKKINITKFGSWKISVKLMNPWCNILEKKREDTNVINEIRDISIVFTGIKRDNQGKNNK